MKTGIFVSSLAISVVLASSAVLAENVKIGEKAPDFSLMDSEGKTRKLSEYLGKIVVLEWTNPECPFVKKHYDSHNIPKQQQEAKSKGVIWLSINSSAKGKQGYLKQAEVKAVQAKWKAAPTAYLFDREGKVGHLYGAQTTPHLYVVDQKGVLRYNGAIDSIASTDSSDIAKATPYVSVTLNELLNGKPVTTSLSQPYGCNIKY